MAKRGFTTSSITNTNSSIAQPQIQVTTVSIAKRYWRALELRITKMVQSVSLSDTGTLGPCSSGREIFPVVWRCW